MPTKDPGFAKGRANRTARLIALGLTLLALIFTAGTFVAPLSIADGNPWGGVMRVAYSPLCHQQPQRSLSVGTGFQAVCARCSGLYLGAVVGLFAGAFLVAGRLRPPRPHWLALAAAPTFLDALLPWVGAPGLPNVPRLLLAWPVGFVAALFVVWGVGDVVRRGADSAKVRSQTNPNDRDTNWTARRVRRESAEVTDG